MEICTKRLRLVELTTAFLDSFAEFAVGNEHIQMMVYFPKDSREELLSYLMQAEKEHKKADPEFRDFAVLYHGKLIGCVTMYFEGHTDRGELGWIIRREYRGKGFASEAAEALMRYFHQNYGICRFIAQCDSENAASRRVIQKLGMRYQETHGGRFNRGSPDERQEELYEIFYTDNPS